MVAPIGHLLLAPRSKPVLRGFRLAPIKLFLHQRRSLGELLLPREHLLKIEHEIRALILHLLRALYTALRPAECEGE